MRAVVLRGGRLEIRETADPVPGPGHLLLRVVSTAICASDLFTSQVIDLDGVPETLEATRRSEGPPRVVLHP